MNCEHTIWQMLPLVLSGFALGFAICNCCWVFTWYKGSK